MSTVGRLLRLVAALSLVVAVLAACSDDSASSADASSSPDSTYEPVTGRVVVVGDSLTVGAAENLQKLADLHGFTLDLSAFNGRTIPEGIPELQRLDAANADLVVVALGTNDSPRPGFDRPTADSLIDQVMALMGNAPVLWINVYRDAGTPEGDAAALFNQALVDAQDRYETLTALDWAAFVNAHPEIIDADRVHHTPDGYVVRSRWMRDEIVSRLRERQPASSTTG
jgi:lysophospholipase L1-like esterase